MVRARILPPVDAQKLLGTESEKFAPLLAEPGRFVVPFVVENDAGDVKGTWTLTSYFVLEGIEVRGEDAREHLAVGRALLHAVRAYLEANGIAEVVTFSGSERIDGMLARAGGRALPAIPWVLPVRKERSCQQQQ